MTVLDSGTFLGNITSDSLGPHGYYVHGAEQMCPLLMSWGPLPE